MDVEVCGKIYNVLNLSQVGNGSLPLAGHGQDLHLEIRFGGFDNKNCPHIYFNKKTFDSSFSIVHRLIGWRWSEVKNNLAVMGFILLSGLAKLGFHRAHFISSKVPESCLLIILGVFFGGILYIFFKDECSLQQARNRKKIK